MLCSSRLCDFGFALLALAFCFRSTRIFTHALRSTPSFFFFPTTYFRPFVESTDLLGSSHSPQGTHGTYVTPCIPSPPVRHSFRER